MNLKRPVERVAETVKGEDEPMARKHPLVSGAMVWLAYPLLLICFILIALLTAGLNN